MKIYVATSWRNPFHEWLVNTLTSVGHAVYDFKRPYGLYDGFKWEQVDPDWESWTPRMFADQITTNERIRTGFENDILALRQCDVCVLLYPCGNSAHFEAGYAEGLGKRVITVIMEGGPFRPELMLGMSRVVVCSKENWRELCEQLPFPGRREEINHG